MKHMDASKVKKRNHTIDLLKGFAIILVVITHYSWADSHRQSPVFPYIINMAIPIFMIITGYVYSLSLSTRYKGNIVQAYRGDLLLKRIVRYTLPVIVVIVWELVDPNITTASTPLDILRWMIVGTSGKGNYYFPVMIQMIFVFPLIWLVIDTKKEKGLWYCFAANAVYELLAWAYMLSTPCYRLLCFRYIFLVSAGVYAFKNHKLNGFLSTVITVTGALFISSVCYWGYVPLIVNRDWATTNFISSMFVVPSIIWVLQNVRMRFLPLEIIGRASYHIFLVQMVFYLAYSPKIKGIAATWQEDFLLSVFICLCIGIMFYYLEKPIQDKVGLLIKKAARFR